jgi:hypothetical protein
MISGDIDVDKLMIDIDQQIEVLSAIAADNTILNEQLRLLYQARDTILDQVLEITRLSELVDPDDEVDLSTLMERKQNPELC